MTSRTPCLAGLRPLSCSCLLTIWVAPENRLAKLRTPRTYCFTAGFSGAPNGVRLQSGRAASGTAHNPGSSFTRFIYAGIRRRPAWPILNDLVAHCLIPLSPRLLVAFVCGHLIDCEPWKTGQIRTNL